MKSAVIYARFSPRRNAQQCESIETQFYYCSQYCDNSELPIAARLSDKVLSGADEDRPALWQAIELLKRGDVLVVYRLDRLARSVYLSDIIERAVKKKGASIVSVCGEGTWNDSDQDWLIRKILQTLAEYERRVTAARTKASMLRHQASGRRMSKQTPFGWAIDPADPARMIENITEQQVIQHIIAMQESSMSLRAICRQLESEGISCRNNPKWHHTTVKRILQRHRLSSLSAPVSTGLQ